MSHFHIKCGKCGKELENTYCAFCEHCANSLLTTEYLVPFRDDCGKGIWKFNWLPVHSPTVEQPCTVVYQSQWLARHLGLEHLYIAFNGFWPERGAFLQSCTFKEFEAAVVLQNARENGIRGLVVASAGNTARAFAHLSIVADFPVIIVVPRMCLMEMWYLEDSSAVPTLAVGDGDYSDAIDVARRISVIANFPFEGGVKNVAKRDGLGTTMLEAVSRIGRLPDHYFQAVGSGTGGIGVWEMSERLLREGRFGGTLPKLHLAQNLPFAAMLRAWERHSRELAQEDLRPELIGQISTRVLSTRYPAYSVQGGVFDALSAAGGKMYGVTNREVFESIELFSNLEGVDIVAASAVAVGALVQAVKAKTVRKDDVILLNITGGGEIVLGREKKTYNVEPTFVSKKVADTEIEEILCEILKKNF
ncbi:Cysteate synthase [Candidatus Sulfobium mesophilum]|uniref:Cysteate synthase n=1 Tax=Candidatus Sulfobium mesophilum TaxID=2016548 RepID=A0A2U3QJS2_9BACT|nr:Cysteate synthase [Candidatus Sulfobium mesophilum]